MNASRRRTTSSVFNIFQQNFPPDKLSLYFREKRSKILGNFVQSAGQFCYSNRQKSVFLLYKKHGNLPDKQGVFHATVFYVPNTSASTAAAVSWRVSLVIPV